MFDCRHGANLQVGAGQSYIKQRETSKTSISGKKHQQNIPSLTFNKDLGGLYIFIKTLRKAS